MAKTVKIIMNEAEASEYILGRPGPKLEKKIRKAILKVHPIDGGSKMVEALRVIKEALEKSTEMVEFAARRLELQEAGSEVAKLLHRLCDDATQAKRKVAQRALAEAGITDFVVHNRANGVLVPAKFADTNAYNIPGELGGYF